MVSDLSELTTFVQALTPTVAVQRSCLGNPNQPTSRSAESDLRCDELILPEAHLLDVIVFIRGCNKAGCGCLCIVGFVLFGVVLLGSMVR